MKVYINNASIGFKLKDIVPGELFRFLDGSGDPRIYLMVTRDYYAGFIKHTESIDCMDTQLFKVIPAMSNTIVEKFLIRTIELELVSSSTLT